MTALLLSLTIGGAVLELVGICLGVLDFRDRGKQLRTFETTLPAQRFTIGTAHEFDRAGGISWSGASLEDRVTALEGQVEQERQALERRVDLLHESATNLATARASDVEKNVGENLKRIEKLLTDVARVSFTAKWALGLLVAGLLLQALSNVLQILSSPIT